MALDDGIWPRTELVVPPDGKAEFWVGFNIDALFETPAGTGYRLWSSDAEGGEHLSAPFLLQDATRPVVRESLDAPRRWYPAGW